MPQKITNGSIADKIIGTSLSNLKKLVIKFAKAEKNILLVGASGTGKELFVELYREASEREKFAPLNCSGLSDTLLGSELFGHVQGAFTDAHAPREGILSSYGKDGVVFLDEIGDASPALQASILRVLQTGDYKPVGSDVFKNINNKDRLLVIAATSNIKNLRQDLSHRFHTFYIPELYERKEDILELIKYFCNLHQIKYISQMAINYLKDDWFWPGNVRELKIVLEQASILCKIDVDETIRCNDLHSIYFDEEKDKSRRIKINKLTNKGKPFDHGHFFKDQNSPETNLRLSLTEARIRTFFDDKTWGPIEESLLKRERDSILISVLQKIEPMIKSYLGNLTKNKSTKITYKNTTPNKWKQLFWEHHASKNRGGTEVSRLFAGEINKKTAQKNLNEAKRRLGPGGQR